MSIFNDSGLITRGYGIDHRILTRGMSKRIDFGGISPFGKRKKEYIFDIYSPIIKKSYIEINIFRSIKIIKKRTIEIYSSVFKSLEKSIKLFSNVNHKTLFKFLDAI